MTAHSTQPINARASTTRLTSLRSHQDPNHGDYPHLTASNQRPRAPSFDLPAFRKSSTISTTSSSSSSTAYSLPTTHALPSTCTYRTSADVRLCEFSKPRVHVQSRRDTDDSVQSEGSRSVRSEASSRVDMGNEREFQYYGRHSNQWLFNDFSVTKAVGRGFRRVFSREREEEDWFEGRGR